jgi:hypothetical protein
MDELALELPSRVASELALSNPPTEPAERDTAYLLRVGIRGVHTAIRRNPKARGVDAAEDHLGHLALECDCGPITVRGVSIPRQSPDHVP